MLTDEELAEIEQRARRFQGAWTGTSGTLAADVMYLLQERREILATLPDAATRSSSPTANESRPATFLRRMFAWWKPDDHDEFAGRSGQWRRVRAEHLTRQPVCQACGRSKDLDVHHIKPFHKHPELELDPDNLITLCGDPCHIVHGHLMSWRRDNPTVAEDCKRYLAKISQAAPRRAAAPRQ